MTEATHAMRYRNLRSIDREREHQTRVLRTTDLPFEEALAHRMAEHAARCAWAEVEYAAWRAGNCVGLLNRPLHRAAMNRLLDAAYAADKAEHAAHRVLRDAEHREEARQREEWRARARTS